VVIIRGLFPRFRYDFLIGLCWFTLLPRILFGSITLYFYSL
jgi:NADH:ubiquinone oxidoreductase subunit H